MAFVAPSILSADFAHLAQSCRPLVTPETPYLHFDVMDGVFVPNISVGIPVLQSLHAAIPDAIYDVHLMITHPQQYIHAFAKAGADIITFHIEAESPIQETARAIRAIGCKAGLSLRPGTPVQALYPHLADVDLVLVMSVEPGFGGQSFMPEAPARIAALRAEAARQNTPLIIEVDGGIDAVTALLCTAAGADLLVAGSAVFGAENPLEALRKLGNSN